MTAKPFRSTRMLALLDVYRSQFRITFAVQMQYRAALLIWLSGLILSPVVYLVVWSTVSKAQGGSVEGYSAGDFAAYFITTMMVNFVAFDWHMWDYEYRVREAGSRRCCSSRSIQFTTIC